jgi:hypothetical protein
MTKFIVAAHESKNNLKKTPFNESFFAVLVSYPLLSPIGLGIVQSTLKPAETRDFFDL